MREHGGRWQIEHTEDFDVWTAIRKSPDGRQVRILVSRDPVGLRRKLAAAEHDGPATPGGAPGAARGGGGRIPGPST
jgi:hypothetical protein